MLRLERALTESGRGTFVVGGTTEDYDEEKARLLSSQQIVDLHSAGGDTTTSGPGGCCNQWAAAQQMLKAGVVQGMSTAAVFGTKPIVEATVLSAMGVTSLAAVTPAAAMIAGIAGGAYAGAMHTLVGRVVSGVMNALLQANTYSLREGQNALLAEVGTIDAPVMGSFVAGYAVRGLVMQSNTDIWMDALSKSVTSTIGGIVQGMVTDAMKQAMSTVYMQNEPVTVGDSKWELFVKTFEKTLKDEFASASAIGGLLVGKTVGSVVGMIAAGQLGATDLDPAERGAAGMAIYLGGWFAGIHGGAEAGSLVDASRAARQPQTRHDIESGLQMTSQQLRTSRASGDGETLRGRDLV